MSPLTTLLALLLTTPAFATEVPTASPTEQVAPAARIADLALQAREAFPETARAIDEARPMTRRTGSLRWIDAPTTPEVTAIWLDLALHGGEPLEVRIARAEAGSLHADPDLLASAFEAADHPRIRGALLRFSRTAPPGLVPALIAPALLDSDPEVRRVAIGALAQRADAADHLSLLQRSLADGSPEVRAAAAFGIGVHGSPTQIRALDGLLTDASPKVRLSAIRAIERIDPAQARTKAAALVSDPDPKVKRDAERITR